MSASTANNFLCCESQFSVTIVTVALQLPA